MFFIHTSEMMLHVASQLRIGHSCHRRLVTRHRCTLFHNCGLTTAALAAWAPATTDVLAPVRKGWFRTPSSVMRLAGFLTNELGSPAMISERFRY